MPTLTEAQQLAIQLQLADAYRKAEAAIVARITRANLTDWQRARALEQLAAIRGILLELDATVTEWGQLHLPGLYASGMSEVNAAIGIAEPTFTKLHVDTVELLAQNLTSDIADVVTLVGRRVDGVFRDAQLNAMQESTLLGETRKQATQRLINGLIAEDGSLTAVRYSNGAMHGLGEYGEMVARTVSAETQRVALEMRMAELGEDLVKVSGHGCDCDICSEYEDEILSLSGASDEYESVDDAIAAGLFHPNCEHRLMPYIPRYAEIA